MIDGGPTVGQARRTAMLWLRHGVLWTGLLLCTWAVWRLALHFDALGRRVTLARLGMVTVCLAAVWLLTVASWRQLVLSFSGARLPWASAMRQSGLLLVGKYVPGSVFGFLARHYDMPASVPRSRVLAAGLYEQFIGLAMPTLAGGIVAAAAYMRQPAWLAGVLLLPWLATAGVNVARGVMRALPSSRLRGMLDSLAGAPPVRRPLLLGCTLSFLATIGWLLLAFALARLLFGASFYAALGAAGAFGLAVGVGMLVVIAPGGMGAREGAFVALAAYWLTPAEGLLLVAAMRLLSVALDLGAGLVGATAAHLAHKPRPAG